ncbi:tyrosine-type recombinase/integrase, partial [Hyphomicrobium sulfonivorans]|uniref:tyrosine-type recombinase/integrase n=1 Tax=Hyphomicrobium sulfonivorans TaxID=121290 RepID=UPI000AD2B401
MKLRQHLDYRRAVKRFTAWLEDTKLPGSIEATSRKTAGRYVSEAMVGKGVHPTTANKDITALSGYWKWLIKKGHCAENIWSGQSLRKLKPKSDDQTPKRPYTDDEVFKLINGIEQPMILDAVTVAALTGMRVAEIGCLRIADCGGNAFRITDAKTQAGIRDVPIHPDLKALVARRSKEKSPNAYLFHELKDPKPGSAVERGQGITRRFTTIRRKLGVDERIEGH